MSFILDALRRADAQRQRASSRGIHAAAGPLPGLEPPRSRRRRLLWAGGGLSLLAVTGALAVLGSGRMAPVPAARPAAASFEPVSLALASAGHASPASGARLLPPAPSPHAGALLAQAQVPAAPSAARRPDRNAPPPAARRPDRNAPPPAATGQAPTPMPPSPRPAAAAAPQPAAPPRAPARSAAAQRAPAPAPSPLPAGAPPFSVSGGVYSSDPGLRMAIINGQVYSQGADVGGGIVIEEIRRDAVVVSYRGERYTAYY